MKKIVKILAPLISFLLALLAWRLTRPVSTQKLMPQSDPVLDYDRAVNLIQSRQLEHNGRLNPLCRCQLLTHGHKTNRVIVFWHGFTNCPQQFYRLGQHFFEQGYNVLLPRLPHHGLADRLAPDQARLTAEEMVGWADDTLNVAHGLGQRVTVAGFSLGGVLAGWAAQYRSDLDQIVLIAPAFWLKAFPARFTEPVLNFLLTAPNFFRWWNPLEKANNNGPQHAYPRFSSRALGHMLRLGRQVRLAARQTKPAATNILVITNPNDWAVDNHLTAKIVDHWRSHGAAVRTYTFEARHRLGHDLIDPDQPAPQIGLVYPILFQLIGKDDA